MSRANIVVDILKGVAYNVVGDIMIVYNDIWTMLKDAGYTQYRIRKEKLISDGTIKRLRKGMSVSTDTIGKLCELCNCQPGDLIIWERDG